MCAGYWANNEESERLTAPYFDTPGGWPADIVARCHELSAEFHSLRQAIGFSRPVTTAGVLAKAKVARHLLGTDFDNKPIPDEADFVASMLCLDIERLFA